MYNVKIIYNNKKKIKADIIFVCTGIKPNSNFIEKKFKENNFIKVNEYLQLINKKNIFVAGDVINLKKEKTAQNAEKQANIVIKNILNLENKKQLEAYNAKKTPQVISLGKYNGIFEYDNFTLKGIIPAIIKYFIEKINMKKF